MSHTLDDHANEDRALELQRLLKAELEDAADFIDTTVGPERAELLRYDRGEPFGDEQEGRSQIVSRDCHDTRVGLLPAVQRVFFGSERVMEFEPGGEDDVALAEQQTDYVHHVIMRQNEGYEILSDAFVDALRQKAGFVKAWWSEERSKKRKDYSGLDAATLALVIEEHQGREKADLEDVKVETGPDGAEIFAVTVTWEEVTKRIKIAALPPEEVLINRGARCLDSARLVAHRRMATKSELVAMGVDPALLEDGGGDDGLAGNAELIARNEQEQDDIGEGANERILYVESYIRLDYDGDGIAELRRICTVGDDCRPISNAPVDERPIADFRCLREPHTFFPEAVEEKVKDIQRIKSMVLRAGMDSLALSTNPRMMYDPARTSFDEAANGEIGALIAVKNMGAGPGLQAIETPFVGAPIFAMLDHLDSVRENRTGVSKAAAGLDAQALQGSSKMAVAGTYSRADAQAETICRDFAEGGMKRLYRLVLRLTAEHQDQVRVKARTGKWIMVDPAAWKLDLNLGANVVIGVMSDEEKLATLEKIAEEQKLVIQTLGPVNPFCNVKHLHATYAKMLAIRGWKSPEAFFTDPETLDPAALAPPGGERGPTPEQTLAEAQIAVERMRTEKTLAIEERKLELRAQEIRLEDDRKRDEMAMKHERDLAAIEAEFGWKREQAEMQAMVAQTRAVSAGEPAQGAAGSY